MENPKCPICNYPMSEVEARLFFERDLDSEGRERLVKFQCLGNNEIQTGHNVYMQMIRVYLKI